MGIASPCLKRAFPRPIPLPWSPPQSAEPTLASLLLPNARVTTQKLEGTKCANTKILVLGGGGRRGSEALVKPPAPDSLWESQGFIASVSPKGCALVRMLGSSSGPLSRIQGAECCVLGTALLGERTWGGPTHPSPQDSSFRVGVAPGKLVPFLPPLC